MVWRSKEQLCFIQAGIFLRNINFAIVKIARVIFQITLDVRCISQLKNSSKKGLTEKRLKELRQQFNDNPRVSQTHSLHIGAHTFLLLGRMGSLVTLLIFPFFFLTHHRFEKIINFVIYVVYVFVPSLKCLNATYVKLQSRRLQIPLMCVPKPTILK